MTRQDRLRAHRAATRKSIEKWIVVWTAMHPDEALSYSGSGHSVAIDARQLLRAMEEAEQADARRVEAERLNAIPVLPDDDQSYEVGA